MFARPQHQRIARVLEALDASKLREHQCYFGGGTAMALRFGCGNAKVGWSAEQLRPLRPSFYFYGRSIEQIECRKIAFNVK